MVRVFFTPLAILFYLNLFRIIFLVLHAAVISSFALFTSKCYYLSQSMSPFPYYLTTDFILEQQAQTVKLPLTAAVVNKNIYFPDYSSILIILPAPIVLPPSRIANLSPSSMAIGVISFTSISVLSPGIIISMPSGSVTSPVTSVVLK